MVAIRNLRGLFKWPALALVAAAGLGAIAVGVYSVPGKGMEIRGCEWMTLERNGADNVVIDDPATITRYLNLLWPATAEIYEKPDLEVVCGARGASDPERIAVYMAARLPGLACRGEYLTHWETRMAGRAADCFRLSPYLRFELERRTREGTRERPAPTRTAAQRRIGASKPGTPPTAR
jgi:hypothetical protein